MTPEEAEILLAEGEDADLWFLGELGKGRRRLSTDWPTGASKRTRWRTGAFHVQEGH
jgi:hypothetical protein